MVVDCFEMMILWMVCSYWACGSSLTQFASIHGVIFFCSYYFVYCYLIAGLVYGRITCYFLVTCSGSPFRLASDLVFITLFSFMLPAFCVLLFLLLVYGLFLGYFTCYWYFMVVILLPLVDYSGCLVCLRLFPFFYCSISSFGYLLSFKPGPFI
ncbi:hypothetical protein BJ508DRAFT_72212 [Ascobolus immersus RN42]|uniref:Uncharacterized protein n=1 Tax=Ascobolus immersus RN42 TaxID=1160509 RepID=A0A3N4HEI1_ASCIM|nr:hypothetical protein BJ508DRAFT_72212 [Ascobolus immersus RN42]